MVTQPGRVRGGITQKLEQKIFRHLFLAQQTSCAWLALTPAKIQPYDNINGLWTNPLLLPLSQSNIQFSSLDGTLYNAMNSICPADTYCVNNRHQEE